MLLVILTVLFINVSTYLSGFALSNLSKSSFKFFGHPVSVFEPQRIQGQDFCVDTPLTGSLRVVLGVMILLSTTLYIYSRLYAPV